MVLLKMNNHEHRTKQTYESYTFQPLMSFWCYIDYSNFDQESYLRDIIAVNWNVIYRNDLRKTTTKITDLIKSIADKHVPIRQLSQKNRNCALSRG